MQGVKIEELRKSNDMLCKQIVELETEIETMKKKK